MFNALKEGFTSFYLSIPRPEALPEEKVAIYEEYGINNTEANLIQKTICVSSKIWGAMGREGGYVEKGVSLPRSLVYRKNNQNDVKVFALLERVVGRGNYMTYEEVLETSSLKTYVFGTVMIKDREHNGEFHSAKYFEKMADQLQNAFKEVGSHPSIVHLHAVVCYDRKIHDEKIPFRGFVFEYCKLGDLEKYVQNGHTLTSREIRRISVDIAMALEYIHSLGIAHYDVKEENILLTLNENGELCAKLCDLGFANKVDRYTGCGSPANLPPEFWMAFPHIKREDYKPYDGGRFDMWAFANVIKWMVEKDHFIPDSLVDQIEHLRTKTEEEVLINKIGKLWNQPERVERAAWAVLKETSFLPEDKPELAMKADYQRMLILKDLYSEMSLYPRLVSSENDTVYTLYCQMLQFDPKKRPASMREVRQRLEAIHDKMS